MKNFFIPLLFFFFTARGQVARPEAVLVLVGVEEGGMPAAAVGLEAVLETEALALLQRGDVLRTTFRGAHIKVLGGLSRLLIIPPVGSQRIMLMDTKLSSISVKIAFPRTLTKKLDLKSIQN